MEISVSEFKKALEIVKPGLALTETTIEQVTSFAFTNKNVITYNDEICIYHPLVDLKLHGAIEAELLYKFLSKVKSEQISLEINETKVTMKSGRIKAEFNIDPTIKLPLDDEKLTEKGKWKKIPENFFEAVSMAKACVSKDKIKMKLTCVHLNESGIIESSDGHRIFRYKLKEELGIKTVLVPADSLAVVLRLKPTKFAEGNGWIHFKNEEDTVISCRIINEEFPDTSRFLKDGKDGVEIDFPKELISTLETAEIFAENNVVKLTLSKKKLTVTSQSQLASFKEELDLAEKVEPFAFQITPYLLKDILKQISSCTIYTDKLIFKNKNWKYMTGLALVED